MRAARARESERRDARLHALTYSQHTRNLRESTRTRETEVRGWREGGREGGRERVCKQRREGGGGRGGRGGGERQRERERDAPGSPKNGRETAPPMRQSTSAAAEDAARRHTWRSAAPHQGTHGPDTTPPTTATTTHMPQTTNHNPRTTRARTHTATHAHNQNTTDGTQATSGVSEERLERSSRPRPPS